MKYKTILCFLLLLFIVTLSGCNQSDLNGKLSDISENTDLGIKDKDNNDGTNPENPDGNISKDNPDGTNPENPDENISKDNPDATNPKEFPDDPSNDSNTITYDVFAFHSCDMTNEESLVWIDTYEKAQNILKYNRNYDPAFFESKGLIIYTNSESTRCITHKVTALTLDERNLNLTVERRYPEVYAQIYEPFTWRFYIEYEKPEQTISSVNLNLLQKCMISHYSLQNPDSQNELQKRINDQDYLRVSIYFDYSANNQLMSDLYNNRSAYVTFMETKINQHKLYELANVDYYGSMISIHFEKITLDLYNKLIEIQQLDSDGLKIEVVTTNFNLHE